MATILFVSGNVFSEEKPNPYTVKADWEKPWQIQADELFYDLQAKEYQAIGQAVVRHAQKTLKADHIVFNAKSMQARAEGNVILEVGEDTLFASSIEINLAEEKGILYDGEIFLHQTHFFIKGQTIEKTDDFSYLIKQGTVTSCEGKDPDWRVTGERIDVTIDEYGFVRNAKLWVKEVPVFYTPFFMFPVKWDRQSGLLMPKFGVSEKKGFEIEQPMYWVINESSDATFYEHFMSQRGHKIGMEYRYVIDSQSKGMLKIDYLKDRQVDDGSDSSSDQWGYDHDDYDRSNHNRYWVRAKQNQALPWGFSGKLDLDIVSDQDYLIAFNSGYTGFDTTLEDFQKHFSRNIEPYEDPVRTNQININKKGEQYTWNTSLKWYDQVIPEKYYDEDKTLQKLPRIQLDVLKQTIGGMPFYVSLDSDYTYFYSEAGTNGHRMDFHPTVYLPEFSTSYFTLEPYAGFRETLWQITKYEDIMTESEKDKSAFRHMMDFHLDLKSELNRVYTPSYDSVEALKHSIYSEIRYTFIPEINQSKYPGFGDLTDGINRIEETNQISFYLAQFVTTKKQPRNSDGMHENSQMQPVYKRTLRFTLEQIYDIAEARSDSPEEYRNGKDKRPFLPLDANLELIAFNFFSISANTLWSYYDQSFIEKNASFNLWNYRGDRLSMAYRCTDKEIETFRIEAGLRLTPRMRAFTVYERDLLAHENVETGMGFTYDRQCWSFEFEFVAKQEDTKYQFMINLKGLGELGSS